MFMYIIFSRKRLDISQVLVQPSGHLNVKLDDDQHPCCILGMDVAADGTLLLADYWNRRIKAVSPGNRVLSFITLSDYTRDITVLNDADAVVATFDNRLHMPNVSTPACLTVQKQIDLEYKVTGIAQYVGKLIILACTKPKSVKMIDQSGREYWSASLGHNVQILFSKPFGVGYSYVNDKATVVVTDMQKSTLNLIDANSGIFIKAIHLGEEKRPVGLTIDKDGNVYICYFSTNEMYVWSCDFQRCRFS